MAQRITSTFQAMKLLMKGERNYKHSRWQMGMNNRRDWEQMSIAIMGEEIGIVCVALEIAHFCNSLKVLLRINRIL